MSSELKSSSAPTAIPSSVETSVPTELPTEVPAGGFLINGQTYDNFSSKEAAGSYRTLNSTTTGCYAENGSMPILLADHDLCNLGFFCPNSTDAEPPQYVRTPSPEWIEANLATRYCPPTTECQALRAMKQTCLPQGRLEPVVCKPGYYCPPGGKEQIECPKGEKLPWT